MRIKKIYGSDAGVAGIIVALLLIGLLFTAIAFVQSVFVPKWMEEREAEHMEEVSKQFSQLKFAVDTLSLAENKISYVNCPITLGSKEMPFLFSSRSYGELEVVSNDYGMNITSADGSTSMFYLNSIRYTSQNAYYINQNYVFENGAIILNQDSGDSIKIYPNIFLNETSRTIVIHSVNFKEVGGKTVASGYGTYPIQTKFSKTEIYPYFSVENLTIYNSHLKVWEKFLNSTLSKSSRLNFTIDYTSDGSGLKVQFFDNDRYDYFPNIDIYVSEMDIKITPGWAE